MPVWLRTTLLTLLTLGCSTADAQAAKLVGVWEMTEPAEAAVSAPVLTLRADGTLEMRLTAPDYAAEPPETGRYTVDGDTIQAVIGGEAETSRYRFDKGDLLMEDRGYVMRFRRKDGC